MGTTPRIGGEFGVACAASLVIHLAAGAWVGTSGTVATPAPPVAAPILVSLRVPAPVLAPAPLSAEAVPAKAAPSPPTKGRSAMMTKPAELATPTQSPAHREEQGLGAGPAQPAEPETPAPAAAPAAGVAAGSSRSPSPGGRSVEIGVSFDAEYLDNPRPAYPAEARRRHLDGLVELRVEVGADGRPGEITVHRSSAVPSLDAAALDAVRRWRFVPARRGETPVAGHVIVPLRFSLSDAR